MKRIYVEKMALIYQIVDFKNKKWNYFLQRAAAGSQNIKWFD
jgi:hypothetical protein